jgi:hypothetical protein
MSNIKLFESIKIRSHWNEDEQKWYFSVADVVEALTDSTDIKQYVKRLRQRDEQLNSNWGTICTPLEMMAADGKKRKIQAANVEGLLRIIQSVPSPKAEPFKRWLAKVGYERLEEIENPELASQRIRDIYKAKGYSDAWIEKRLRGIAVRDELTDQWQKRGIKEQREFAILTSEISRATFGLSPSEYKELKNLPNKGENLRDHMNDLELIFTMLGEASTTEITKTIDAKGFAENKVASKKGGEIAGNARVALEKETGKNIVSKENYLQLPEKEKRKLK